VQYFFVLVDSVPFFQHLKTDSAAEDHEGWRAVNRSGMPQTCYAAHHYKMKLSQKENEIDTILSSQDV